MGFVIVMIVGAILGWLASIIVERDDRLNAAVCAIAGIAGAVISATVSGDVPLLAGVTPTQLLWAVLGALVAIVAVNAAGVTQLRVGQRKI